MFYLRYLYLLPYSGVQHILWCVFCFVCLPLVCPVCFFYISLSEFSNVYLHPSNRQGPRCPSMSVDICVFQSLRFDRCLVHIDLVGYIADHYCLTCDSTLIVTRQITYIIHR
jgi:hypothetical protein